MAKYKLGDIAPIQQGSVPESESYWLLNLDMVESNTGHIYERLYVPFDKIGTSTIAFDTNNVLYSKLRPYLNKVVIPDCPGYATSEMLPLKPNKNYITREYLTYFLRSPKFVAYINEKTSGAKMPRANSSDLKSVEIECPTLENQRHITSEFDRIISIVRLRQQQLQKLDELVKARFVELFGDLANPSCLWETIKLADACASADDIKCGPFGTQLGKGEYVDSGVAVWEIPQINAAFKACPTHFITEEKATQLKAYSLVPGDIAMSRKGNVGRCAIFPDEYVDGIIHSDVLRIRVNEQKVNPVFMMYQLHFSSAVINQIEMVSSGAIMAGVNVTKLKQIYVHIPPKKLQDQFVSFVKQTDKSKVAVQKALNEAQLLFDSLMQTYFDE